MMALILKHQTPAEFAARLVSRFRAASDEEKARIATWLFERHPAGDFSGAPIAAFAANYPRKLHCRAGLWNRRKRVTTED